MKNQIIKIIGSAILLVSTTFMFSRCDQDIASTEGVEDMKIGMIADFNPAMTCQCLNDNYPVEVLSDAETQALLYMREEEKLARDVYKALNERWSMPVFANISQSEQRHMDAVLCLITKYALSDPVGDNAAGVFQNSTLQGLYTTLTQQGLQSMEAAFRVGAKIEDLDINDLMEAMPNMDNADIKAVFESLTKGSRNHLRAFSTQISRLGETYTPEFISADLYNEILQSGHETGGGTCMSNCPGGGNRFNRGNRGANCMYPNNPNPPRGNARPRNRRGN